MGAANQSNTKENTNMTFEEVKRIANQHLPDPIVEETDANYRVRPFTNSRERTFIPKNAEEGLCRLRLNKFKQKLDKKFVEKKVVPLDPVLNEMVDEHERLIQQKK
jgi:hypothetical protein